MDNHKIGTFLICPDCSGKGRDTMNIELSSGLIYEIINADSSIDTLQSGTKVILPPVTEITADSKIDIKGGKLNRSSVFGWRTVEFGTCFNTVLKAPIMALINI